MMVKRLVVLSVFTLAMGSCLPDSGTGRFAKGVFGLLTVTISIEPLLEIL